MIIGALRLTFVVPTDGKSTRSVAQKIKSEMLTRFKASVAELSTQGAELFMGASIVGNEEKLTRERLDSIIHYFREWGHADLANDESELVHFDDLELERDFEKYNP